MATTVSARVFVDGVPNSVPIMYPKKETRDENLAARRRCDAGQRVHGVPEDQQRPLGLLVEATDSVIRGLSGFASAKPH